MFDTMKSKVAGLAVVGSALASSAMASEAAGGSTSVDWATITSGAQSGFVTVINKVGPIALAVVVAVAGVRVAIKLINRGAGK
jgi:hypothetical protein